MDSAKTLMNRSNCLVLPNVLTKSDHLQILFIANSILSDLTHEPWVILQIRSNIENAVIDETLLCAYQELKGLKQVKWIDLTHQNNVMKNPAELSYRIYDYLRHNEFKKIYFYDYFGLGYISMQAKRVGVDFENTEILLAQFRSTRDEIEYRSEPAQDLNTLAIIHMERKSIQWANRWISPSPSLMQGHLDRWVDPGKNQASADRLISLLNPKSIAPQHTSKAFSALYVLLTSEDASSLIPHVLNILGQLTGKPKCVFFSFLGNSHSVPLTQLKKVMEGLAIDFGIKRPDSYEAALDEMASEDAFGLFLSAAPVFSFAGYLALQRGLAVLTEEDCGLGDYLAPHLKETLLCSRVEKDCAKRLDRVFNQNSRPEVSLQTPKPSHQSTQTIVDVSSREVHASVTPLVSICLIHFNRPEFLKMALESIKKQTYPHVELILVDDGSTLDEAKEFLAGIEADFIKRNWKLIRQENAYLGAARNRAAQEARGEFILFMDDDNIAMEDEVAILMKAALRTSADIVTCRMINFEGDGTPNSENLSPFYHAPIGNIPGFSLLKNTFGDANCLIKSSSFAALGGFTDDIGIGHEDYELFLEDQLRNFVIEVVPRALYYYRVQPNSMLRSTNQIQNSIRDFRPVTRNLGPLSDYFLMLRGYPHLQNQLIQNHKRAIEVEKANINQLKTAINTYKENHVDQSMIPKISVLMLVENHAHQLYEVIDSILGQTLIDFEFVIVDNHTTDQSSAILKHLSLFDSRLRVIRTRRKLGRSDALNIGLSYCRAKWIALMDTYHTAVRKRLAHQWAELRMRPGTVLIGSSIQSINSIENEIDTSTIAPYSHKDMVNALLGGNCPIVHATVLMSKEAIQAVGGYDQRLGRFAEHDLFLKLSQKGRILNIPEALLVSNHIGSAIDVEKTPIGIKYYAITESLLRRGYQDFSFNTVTTRELDALKNAWNLRVKGRSRLSVAVAIRIARLRVRVRRYTWPIKRSFFWCVVKKS